MPSLETQEGRLRISKLYHYPIKALRPAELDAGAVTKHGFRYDRRFLLLEIIRKQDGSIEHKNVHVAHYPESVHFFPAISHADDGNGKLTVTYKPPSGETKTVEMPLTPDTANLETVDTIMHKSPTKAFVMEQNYCDWFSACYGKEMILAYLGDHRRPVRMSTTPGQAHTRENNSSTGWLPSLNTLTTTATRYWHGTPAEEEPTITFADCAPFLIVNSTSLNDLQTRLPADQPTDIIKFRPNIIVSGSSTPWEEDYWRELTIGSARTVLACVHNCGRCKSINIDYTTGAHGTTGAGQLLKLMQRDRRVDPGMKYSPIFGRYAFVHAASEGEVIRVGDEVLVSGRNEERTVFDWDGLCTVP